MNKFFLLIIIFCNACNTNSVIIKSKCIEKYDKFSGQVVYTFVDQLPEYPGGFEAVPVFFKKNIMYPDQEYFQSSFILEFIINENGEIVAPRIKGKTQKELTNAEIEVIRVLKMMPNWEPGKCVGKNVPVLMYLNLKF